MTEEYTAIILAGGKSSRMGQDKGLMLLNGKPMVEHLIATCKQLTSKIIIIANNSDYEVFGFPVYKDLEKEKGPLGGIVTGLFHSTTPSNWIMSCDSPYVSKEVMEALASKNENKSVVISSYRQKLHPLIGVYCKTVLVTLQQELKSNNLKVLKAINLLGVTVLNGDDFDKVNFVNLNTPQDLC